MHEIIRDHLEDYLQKSCSPLHAEAVASHLAGCGDCRRELAEMAEAVSLLSTLKPGSDDLAPSAGFYGKVMARIEAERKPSFWGFLLDPVFGKRLVFASLALVAMLTTYLVSVAPPEDELAALPEIILSRPSDGPSRAVAAGSEQDRDAILVNLATYRD